MLAVAAWGNAGLEDNTRPGCFVDCSAAFTAAFAIARAAGGTVLRKVGSEAVAAGRAGGCEGRVGGC